MRYLIFMDFVSQNWREAGVWIGLVLSAWFAIYLIRSKHLARSTKTGLMMRSAGALLLVVVGLSFCTFMFGKMLGDAPRERTAVTSNSGNRVALVSHSSYRDFTTTQVAVKGINCCRRYIASLDTWRSMIAKAVVEKPGPSRGMTIKPS